MRHCVIALLMLLGAQTAVSDDAVPASMPETLAFNVSTGGHPPFTIVHGDGRVSGIFWDVLSAIADRFQVELLAVQVPPKRSESLLLSGHVDVTMRAMEWVDDPQAFVFSDPVMMTRDALFVHRDSDRKIDAVEDLEGTLLGRLGFHYPWLAERLQQEAVSLIPVQDQEPMLRRLYDGRTRFTGAISNLHAGYWTLKNVPWGDSIREAPIRLDEVGFRLMFPPRHQALVPRINQELQRLRSSGELDRIIRAYQ
ncbi:extracellular solute-binding protein, family 3 [Marinobacter segnicrescens]|uniref:Extracellular solute-binding protein, family 3 n=1 Tax=Marinobacter segnicrescens TaxID=430453 RepID=A0A1I0CC95_9GAMM|nr:MULTISPECIES: transporter substrate-binding domain-containing protein [Marinobacter]UZD64917.1 transporter substrate-binding domain-containing protein [Marinobacter sp. AN1]SET17178.1 extracellular solute-binding protein, family 3 [Marinobacter segnicrescens]